MRLAIIISTTYDDNPKLEPHRAGPLDAAVMAEQLMLADADFVVERLEADRDLPEHLESLLEQYPGDIESLALYFSGYAAVSKERGPAVLLSGARLKAYPISRLRGLLVRSGTPTLCILDVAVMSQGARWPNDIAQELAAALSSPSGPLGALVAVRLLASQGTAGFSRFTDLFAVVLQWLTREAHDSITVGDVYAAMQQERASFDRIVDSYCAEPTPAFPLLLGSEPASAAPTPDRTVAAADEAEATRSQPRWAYLPSAPPSEPAPVPAAPTASALRRTAPGLAGPPPTPVPLRQCPA